MSQTTLNERNARIDQYLQTQMRKTGNQVRLIDLFTCCMKLFAGVLGGLFLLAVVDGWIVELAGWARWMSLLLILGGAATYFVLSIVPLLIRRINPVYAAKVVEESQPEMKNSLINYLLLKRQPERVSRRIVEIVGSKAANDISGVPVENTVDKSHTIQAALILTVLVVTLGAYKVLSPKDPFQSFARIIAPSSAITKPSRVKITEVEPGNAEVFFGQELEVSAFIDGTFDPETAKVVFSTLDGQIVDGTIQMLPGQRDKYTATLRTGDKGIEQSLRYKVVAGDGVSNEYTVTLTSSPILSVERIKYEPPPYMELEPHTIEGITTIDAYEGTMVTLEAVANTDIKSCYVQLLREDGKNLRQVNTVSMEKIDDRHGRCNFRLSLNSSRTGYRYTHYQLNLITSDGSRSQPIAANRILVKPDLAPEIVVIDPEETELEVPANSRLRFEVRANDADFKLSGVKVAVEDGTRRVVSEDLKIGQQTVGQSNQLTWEFWPRKAALKAGDIVEVQFGAFDNRESEPGNLDPNRTLTERYQVTITQPIDNPPKEDQQNQSDSEKNQGEGQGDKEEEGQSGDSGEEGESGDSGQGGKSQEGGEQSDQSQTSEGSEGEGESTGGESDDETSSNNQGKEGSESSGDGQSQNESSEGGETGEGGEPNSDAAQSGGRETGQSEGSEAGDAGQDNSTQGGQDTGDQPTDNQAGGQGDQQINDQQLSEDAHASEIFEEIQKYRDQQQENTGQNQTPQDSAEQNPSAGDQNQNQSQNQDPSAGDQSQGGSPENASDQTQAGSQDSAESPQEGAQQPETSQQQGGSDQSQQQEEGQTGDQQEQSSSSDSPETDDQGMDQKGQSDAQSTNEGSAEQEAGESGQSQQEQNQTGSESGDQQSSSGGDQSQQEDQQDQQQQQEGGGSDSQESEQQQATGGGNQEEQTGSGGGEQETSGSQEGEQGQEGQQQGESGNSESSNDQQNSQGQSDSSNQDQSGSGEQSESGEQSSNQSGQPSEGQQQGSQSGGEEGSQSDSEQKGQGQQESQSNEGQEQGQSGSQQSDQANQQSGQSGSGEAEQGQQPKQGGGEQSGEGGNQGQQDQGQSSEEQSGGNNPGAGSASNQTSNQSGNNSAADGEGGTTADEANLEYTKKATDMALEYLEDQMIEPDPKLLDKLNWTEEDLRKFVDRWKELKQAAASGDEKAKREYERRLESLGLGDGDSTKRRFDGKTDDQQGYQEDGRVDAPPPEFAERYRAFSRERNKVRDER